MEGWFANIPGQLNMLLEVFIAAVLGGIIGIERELADKPAGFRTLMLVAGAAALLIKLGQGLGAPGMGLDAMSDAQSRIVQAIITGISFLGAGTIIRRSHAERVEGLTTAAAIFAAAAIGICVAADRIVLAVGVTGLALVVLIGFRGIDRRLDRLHKGHDRYHHDG